MIRDCCLGIDTSCYTTSVACVEEQGIVFSERTMLSVPFGGRGLRQSEGLFQHTKQLAPLLENLFKSVDRTRIGAVAVSTKPTDDEQSYMPVFLAGRMAARSVAAALGVPCIETNHQAGHFRAASVGNEALSDRPFYGIHISGGTTDLLMVEPNGKGSFSIRSLGRSTDLHAGQFVDRVGVALGLPFPAGKHLESLARKAQNREVKPPAAVKGMDCSFSGAESAVQRLLGQVPKEEIAFGVYDCLSRTLFKLLRNARQAEGERPALLCGGVASSALLRELLCARCDGELYFGRSELCADNAVGVAYLGLDRREAWKN